MDEIEALIEELKKTKNRREKRILLAKYNNKQAKIWGSFVPYKGYTTDNNQLAVYENDDKYIWNPLLHGYVDRVIYEKALKTDDPTRRGYRGVSPNFGGNNQEEGRGIGTTPKHMRKLTTVLSKNQKLNSMNVPHFTKKFENKANL